MAAKFLGQFLLERGTITSAQLLAALDAQRASNPLLGELAMHHGMLDATQARRIHERQRAEDRRFGDIALEMGWLNEVQLDVLLAAQKKGRKLFGQILVDQGVLDAERLEAELTAHRRDLDEANHALALGIAGHTLPDDASYRAQPPSTQLSAADLTATGRTLALSMASQRGDFVLIVG